MKQEFKELDVSKIQKVSFDTEIPVHNNCVQTKRPLCVNFPENEKIVEHLEAISDPSKPQKCDSDLFKGDYKTIKNIEDLKKALSELLVRFDTSPENYTKADYSYLMKILYKSLLYLYDVDPQRFITNEWSDPLASNKVPSEKLVKETIDSGNSSLVEQIQQVILSLENEISNRENMGEYLENLIQSIDTYVLLTDEDIDEITSEWESDDE